MNSDRLFVKPSDVFTLEAFFTKEGELKACRKEDIPPGEENDWEKFEIEFGLPDFATAKGIMRSSTDYDSGASVLNMGLFNSNLLTALARSWNLREPPTDEDKEGKEISLDLQKLNELRPDITRLFVELLQEKLNKEGLYNPILLS